MANTVRKQNPQLQMTQSCYGRQTDDGELAGAVRVSILALNHNTKGQRQRVHTLPPPPKTSTVEMKKSARIEWMLPGGK